MKTLRSKIKELRQQIRIYKRLCVCDFLTGLYNRRKLEEDLQRYIELNERHRIRFELIMIDINKFKDINDSRGHKIGDKVLREVGRCLQSNIRKTDRAYRLAGDEFIIIFSHHKNIKKIVARIRQALSELNITISVGRCSLTNKYKRDVMEIVDKRMYEEKRKKC